VTRDSIRAVEGFDFVHRQTVRFRDVDVMGHVNNAVYLTYMESARVAYLLHLGTAQGLADLGIIVARVEIDFRAPVSFGEEVEIGVRTSRFGTKSFDLEYELRASGRVVAQATSVCVGYDYLSGTTVPIPEAWRESLAA
jgi:acyl-CoA thioester hydrolase